MKLAFISLCSWFIGLLTLLCGLSLVAGRGTSILNDSTMISLISSALVFALAYGPSLTWLKKYLRDSTRVSIFPLTSSLVLNLPVFLVTLLAIGRTLLAGEAYALMISYAAMGATFGLGFVLSSRRPKRIREPRSWPIIAGGQSLAGRAN